MASAAAIYNFFQLSFDGYDYRESQKNDMNYIVYSMGTSGDVLPFLRLSEELKARGHSVLFLGNEKFSSLIDEKGIEFFAVSSRGDYDRAFNNHTTWTLLHSRDHYNKFHFPAIAPTFSKIKSLVDNGSKPCVIFQDCLSGARMACDEFDLSYCQVVLAPQAIFSCVSPPFPLSQQFPQRQWPTAMPFIRAKGHRSVYEKLFDPLINPLRKEMGLPALPIENMPTVDQGASLIGMFPSWLKDIPSDWPRQLETVGFPLGTSQKADVREELRALLGEHAKPVVFTFGTGIPVTQLIVEKVKRICVELDEAGVLVSQSLSDECKYYDDAKLVVTRYADFATLFPCAQIVMHHGGIGTCAEALAAGVPQLLTPYAFDQPDNAYLLWKLGVGNGINFHTSSARDIARMISEMTGSKQVKEMCEKYSQLCHRNAISKAADIIENTSKQTRKTS